MSDNHNESTGNRAVLIFAALLLVAGLAAGIAGLKAGGGHSPLATGRPSPDNTVETISCIRTKADPGPQLDLGVQANRRNASPLPRATVNRLVHLAKRAGATVISTTADWAGEQPTRRPAYHWATMDEVIDSARAAGLQVRLVLQRMPSWAIDTKRAPAGPWRAPLTRKELTRWSGFVNALSRHVAGRVRYLEVWTEPDLRKTWSTGPDPVAFARLLHATYPVVKRAAPQVQVISGGLSSNDLGFLGKLYAAKAHLYGAKAKLFDMVGVHPYSANRSPRVNRASYDYQRAPFGEDDQNFLGFRRVHAVMAAHGDGPLKLYIGEFGYSVKPHGSVPAVRDSVRAVYAKQALSAAACYPYVQALSWYYLYPTAWDPPSWTLLTRDFVPNKTYQALVAWSREKASAG